MTYRPTHRHGLPLAPQLRERLRSLVQRTGDTRRGALALGIGEPAISRALAGQGLRTSTLTAIKLGLDALERDESNGPTAANGPPDPESFAAGAPLP
jgi:hypothetical protein